MDHLYRTWIEVSKSAIRNNYSVFKKMIKPSTKMLGVVKSNAYGHGLFDFARILKGLGIDWLGVDSITEANALRIAGIKKPMLVMGYTLPVNFELAHHHNISLTLSDKENLKSLLRQKRKISIHLKVDTGMHRQGFCLEDLPHVLRTIKKSTHIKLEGLYTHFAAAKRPDHTRATERQMALFKQVLETTKSFGLRVIAHAAATAGTLNFPEAQFDMVRIGIGLYGLWPSLETKQALQSKIKLKPVLAWKTIISELKTVEKGEKIGYDYTEELKRTSKLAILPIGYWHGYFRVWSGKSYVLVKGQKCKVIGRVAMDMVVVDVTDVPSVKIGNEAVLIGRQGKKEITADELADLANTTNYEVITRLNPLIKKIYA